MFVKYEFDKTLIYNNIKKIQSGCWLWTGSLYGNGYPRVQIEGKIYLVTRLSLHLFKGFDLDSPLDACHKDSICGRRSCVNPDHLFAGTRSDNMHDFVDNKRGEHWNAEKTHCKWGHKFTKSNTYKHRGKRQCIRCKELRQQGKL